MSVKVTKGQVVGKTGAMPITEYNVSGKQGEVVYSVDVQVYDALSAGKALEKRVGVVINGMFVSENATEPKVLKQSISDNLKNYGPNSSEDFKIKAINVNSAEKVKEEVAGL